MSYRVIWSEAALDRAAEFLDFIAEDNPAAARRVVQQLFERVEALAEYPRLGRRLAPEVDPALRRLVAGNYVVVYAVQEERQIIAVVAVRHSRQRLLPPRGTLTHPSPRRRERRDHQQRAPRRAADDIKRLPPT